MNIKMQTLASLKELRFGYKDEIPPIIVNSLHADNLYKVRAAWWSRINAILERFDLLWGVDGSVIKEWDDILDMHMANITKTWLTKAEDIALANIYLDKLISILEAS